MKALFIRKRGNMEIKEWREIPDLRPAYYVPVRQPTNAVSATAGIPDYVTVSAIQETYTLREELPDGTLVYVNEN